jgi:hypothetical protein
MAPAVFMKPFVGGGDESLTRPPPREVHKMPASGPAFWLKKRALLWLQTRRMHPKDVSRLRQRVDQLVRWTVVLAGTPSPPQTGTCGMRTD